MCLNKMLDYSIQTRFDMKLLVLFFLIYGVCIGAVSAQQRESAAWQVVKYDITATLPSAAAIGNERALTAKASLTVKNVGRAAGSSLTLRLAKTAIVSAVKSAAGDIAFTKGQETVPNFQTLRLNFAASFQPNETATVTVEYHLPVNENSAVNAISPIDAQFVPITTTNAETAPLILWYPTPANPLLLRGGDAAPFRLNVTAPNGQTVVSSGKADGNSFEQNLNGTPFFLAGNWEETAAAKNVAVFLPKGASDDERRRAVELANLTDAARSFMTARFGALPSDVPMRLIAVRRGAGFSDGGAILLEEAAFRRQKISAETAMAIAEATAKMWFGNAIVVRGEGYGAIREGLARFAATQFIEKQFGQDAADIERLRQRTAFAAVAKRDAPLTQLSPLDEIYYAANANKGAMIWRLTAREMGEEKFFSSIRQLLQTERSSNLTLAKLRENLIATGGDNVKRLFDNYLDQATDTDLLVGLPQTRGAQTVCALRNAGSVPVTVDVIATTDKNEKLTVKTQIAEKSFGEAAFNTTAKVARVEIDPEKFYPQIDYANDIAPRAAGDSDNQAEIKRAFDKQDFAGAETAARKVLTAQSHFDDARTWLGRALLEQNRADDAEREFKAALAEKLPTARTLAWANIGLGEIALKRNQNQSAVKFFDTAINANGEYGTNLLARQERIKSESVPPIDESARAFFAQFDKAVLTKRKTEIDALILSGELNSFTNRLAANQPEQWQTKVLRSEKLDDNRMAVEVSLTAKLINKEPTSGTALFYVTRTSNGFKMSGIDLFEVR